MNRCIQCYRCVRTYQDYCGGDDFGVLGCNQRIYFGRFRPGRLESLFSGNLVDVCPTGVFTDKTFRFNSRYWDLEEAPSICPHCSLGCATVPGARYRELQRVRAGVNRQTNGFFICDRGRFGYGHANHPERIRVPRVAGAERSWPEALATLRDRVEALVAAHGAGSVAFLGSPRASLEANGLLRLWAKRIGGGLCVPEPHPQRDRTARVLAAGLGDLSRSLADLRRSDFVLLVGADPLAEGPLVALAIRQAVRAGAQVAVLDPRPVELPCAAAHLPLAPERLPLALAALAQGQFEGFSRQEQSLLEGVAARLQEARRPVLVGGGDLLGEVGVNALLATARALSREDRPCGVSVLLAGPNSFGTVLFGEAEPDCDTLLDSIRDGAVRGLVCLECDPFLDHPDPGRVEAALARLEFLVVLDGLPGQAARRADILLPTRVPAEYGGTFVNQEGRLQAFAPVFAPGTPLRVTGDGDHPPRTFLPETPGAQPWPAWSILAALTGGDRSLAEVRRELAAEEPALAALAAIVPEDGGHLVAGIGTLPPAPPEPLLHCVPEGTLRLLPVEGRFGSELLASLSAPLDSVRPEPQVLLHEDDGRRLGLAPGDRARLTTDLGHVEVAVRLSSRMAAGLAIVPRLRGSALEAFVPSGLPLACRVEKGGAA
jgi:NADH-quinone oxidoreductase subunit G